MNYSRIRSLRQQFSQHQINAVIVSKPQNFYYLTGIRQIHPTQREALLFLTSDDAFIYHSSLLEIPESKDYTSLTFTQRSQLTDKLNSLFKSPQTIAIEGSNLTVNELDFLKKHLNDHTIKPTNQLIETIRLKKDQAELASLKQSCQAIASIMDWAINHLKKHRHQPLTEIQMSHRMQSKLLEMGINELAFPIHVAFDEHTASPHHTPTKKPLTPNSIILLDLGCKVEGYCSDITRTICLGEPSEKFQEVQNLVHQAYDAAITAARDKAPAQTVDHAARSLIESHGYGDNFITSTGHGLGLEIHEQPSLNKNNDMKLQENMTLTIEPGIYLKGKFGYRHENTIHISKNSPNTLTKPG